MQSMYAGIKRPDFVIMDISMPVLSGLEAAKVINEEKLAGFIIILTAYRDKDIAKQAVDIDVMGYIVKPVDEDALIPPLRLHSINIGRLKNGKRIQENQGALSERKYLDRPRAC